MDNRITPEMVALWDAYQALKEESEGDDMIVYPSEMARFQAELWRLFAELMNGAAKGEGS